MPTDLARYEIELHCGRCHRTTVHLVTSGNGGVSRVTCIACGRAEVVHTLQFMEQYVNSVMRRLMAKPFEIASEFTRNPREFVVSLPGRMLSKPIRVAAEMRTTLDIIMMRRQPPSQPPVTPLQIGVLPAVERRCKLLLSAPLLWAHPAQEILKVAHDLGYDGVELWAYQLIEEGADLRVLATQARSLGLMVTLHGLSWDLNLTSRLEAVRVVSLEALHRCAGMAAEIGAPLLVIHPGHTTMPYDAGDTYWPALVSGIRDLADHAARDGITVGVEHMEARQTQYVVSAEDANRLVREVDRPNVGTVVDVAHIPWGTDELSFFSRLDRVIHVHLSDADETRLHLPLGQGHRDLARILTALRGYEGAVTIEGFSISAGTDLARWNKAQFEELWRAAAAGVPGEVVPNSAGAR